MIFSYLIFPLVVFFIKKEQSQKIKIKTSINIIKISFISVASASILDFKHYKPTLLWKILII